VAEGATFLTTFFSGMVDENDTVYLEGSPGPLREVLGLRVEETDALPAGKTNGLTFARAFGEIPEGTVHPAGLLCDRLRLEGAEPIAAYAEDFYAGEAAFTVNGFGEGRAYYLAARPDDTGLRHIIAGICAEKSIASPLANGAPPPEGVEVNVRVAPDGAEHLYLLNHNRGTVDVSLPEGAYTDLLTEETISGTVTLSPRGVRILEHQVAGG
jgi:beta-galactosidase